MDNLDKLIIEMMLDEAIAHIKTTRILFWLSFANTIVLGGFVMWGML